MPVMPCAYLSAKTQEIGKSKWRPLANSIRLLVRATSSNQLRLDGWIYYNH